MYRSSPFRSTLNTGYITCLGMCKVCTEAVHSVALWTRVTLRWDMCKVCTEAVHSVALWTCVVKTCQFHGAVNTSSAKTTSRVEGHLRNCQESSNPPRKKNIWIFWRGRSWSVVFFSNLCLAQKTTPKTPTTPHLLERGFFHWFPGIQSIKITRKDICNCGLDPPSCVD